MLQKVKVGLVGCGNISGIYFQNCKKMEILELTACADLIPERAQAAAAQYGVRACSTAELMADPEIEIVLNLTTPQSHYSVAMQALQAGKSVYNEKPLTLQRTEAQEMLALAAQKHLLVGCAPDTFMGGGLQTCRKLIDDGWIGTPVSAVAFMLCPGHESWHPAPEFYYKAGGGPMFDMGPYYLTALTMLLGATRSVAGMTRITYPERLITSQPLYGTRIQVDVPTHVAGLMEFASGAIGTIITSFDVQSHRLPNIEIYGSAGTLAVPDPNTFGGPVMVRRAGDSEFRPIPLTHIYAENSRAVGLADMATALRTGRKHRASGELAYHVLDIMHAFHDAHNEGRRITLQSTCERPAMLPLGLRPGTLEE